MRLLSKTGHSEHLICNAIRTPSSVHNGGRGDGLARVEGKGLLSGHCEGIPCTMLCATIRTHWSMDTLPARQHREGHDTPSTRDSIWSGVGEANRVMQNFKEYYSNY